MGISERTDARHLVQLCESWPSSPTFPERRRKTISPRDYISIDAAKPEFSFMSTDTDRIVRFVGGLSSFHSGEHCVSVPPLSFSSLSLVLFLAIAI